MSFKYRKKPVVIEAFQYKRGAFQSDETQAMPQWLVVALGNGTLFVNPNQREQLMCKTLESGGGAHEVADGDYIIRGVQGELYPCKPDIFAATYEAVE